MIKRYKMTKTTVILIFLIIFQVSCKDKNTKDICLDEGFARGVFFPKLGDKFQRGVFYLYESNTKFDKLVAIKEFSLFRDKDYNELTLFPKDRNRFSLKYDYRIVIDDTICFDLSEFIATPDTMGKTMGGWAIQCKLNTYKCNDSIYHTQKNQYIDIPYESRRIIKKGEYDK